jgi:hypothetical protein
MPSSKTYHGISPDVWACMKAKAVQQYGTVYFPSDGDSGTATTINTGQKVIMAFDHDPIAATLTYTIVSKGFFVPELAIWNGIRDSIAACKHA